MCAKMNDKKELYAQLCRILEHCRKDDGDKMLKTMATKVSSLQDIRNNNYPEKIQLINPLRYQMRDSWEIAVDDVKYVVNEKNASIYNTQNDLEYMFSSFKKEIAEITKRKKDIYIVNVGTMNHGKSSLFNSLLETNAFETGDMRVTRQSSAVQLKDNIYLVDTPGLDADDNDDDEAFEAYRKADFLIFVHNPRVGEFHKGEIDHLSRIADIFPSREYFSKHFCLAITFKEEYDDDILTDITNKITADIEKMCKIKGFPIFYVSNSCYDEGLECGGVEGKELVEYSGIEKLRKYILGNVSVWRNESKQRLQNEVDTLRNKYVQQMIDVRDEYVDEYNNLIKHKNDILQRLDDLESIVQRLLQSKAEIKAKERKIASLTNELSNIEKKHRADKSNY